MKKEEITLPNFAYKAEDGKIIKIYPTIILGFSNRKRIKEGVNQVESAYFLTQFCAKDLKDNPGRKEVLIGQLQEIINRVKHDL